MGVLDNPVIKAGALSEVIGLLLGFKPRVVQGPGYAEIQFTPEQEQIVVAFLSRQLSKAPGPVRIRVQAIAIQTFIKNYWYVLAGPFMGGFLTGRSTKK